MLEKCIISGFADEIDNILDSQLKVLKEVGQDYIVYRGADGVTVGQSTMEQIQSVYARLTEAGIRVSSLGSPSGKQWIHEDFEPHFEHFKQMVAFAKAMDTRYIRMFSFFVPQDEDPAPYEAEVVARLKKMIEYAREQDVILLHENEKGIYGDVASRCLSLMEQLYCDNFKCAFDFANFAQCGQNTLEAYEMLKPYISYVHIKDAVMETGEVVLPGTGDGHVQEILEMLDRDGYEGFLSLEPHLVNYGALGSMDEEAAAKMRMDGAEAYKLAHKTLSQMIGR